MAAVWLWTSSLTALNACKVSTCKPTTLALAGVKVRTQERAHRNQVLPPKRGAPGTPAVTLGATVTTQECPGHRDTEQKAGMYSGFNLRTLWPLLLPVVNSNGINRTKATSRG